MNKGVICYVPGSGGVKFFRLLNNSDSIECFVPQSNSHQHKKPNSFVPFSLRRNITGLISTVSKPDLEHGDSNATLLFPCVNQVGNLVDSNQENISSYCSDKWITFTHCMSNQVTSLRHPDRTQIKIVCDIILSLRRWWVVYAQYQEMQTPFVNECYLQHLSSLSNRQQLIASLLIMHLEYYNQYYDRNADYVLNLDNSDDEFSEFMRKDFHLCQNNEFDAAWDWLVQHPKILSIWQKLNNKNT